MKLFDEFERDYMGWAEHSEEVFTFLNRSAQPLFANVRDALEEWLLHYPEEHTSTLQTRFRDVADIHNHEAAFFELFLHEFLWREQCQIEVEKEVEKGKKPDFTVTPPNGSPFILEARCVSYESQTEQATSRRKNLVYDVLNSVDCPDFSLYVQNYKWNPKTPLPLKRVRKEVEEFVAWLHREKTAGNINEKVNRSRLGISHDGEFLVLEARLNPPTYGGGPPLGCLAGGSPPGHANKLKVAVKDKAKHYGALNQPFIIAVNDHTVCLEVKHIARALYEHPSPMSSRLSGVLVFGNLQPWLFHSHCFLCPNPRAEFPVPALFDGFPRLYYRDGLPETVEGKSVLELVGLPDGWPHEP